MLHALYLGVILVCIAPIIPGLLGAILPALGYLPPLNLTEPSLKGLVSVFDWNGIWTSISLSIYSAGTSTFLACLISFIIIQATWGTKFWRKLEKTLAPLLALPHVAFAIGFAFLFSPTGLISRVLSLNADLYNFVQSLSGGALLIKDSYAVGLIVMLTIKEVPFLLLMSISILHQLNIGQTLKVSQAMGYEHSQIWWKCIFPQWLSGLRFPIFAVIAYGLSVVDVALVLGPTNPPTFAVLVWQWFNDPDLTFLPRAASGALLLFIIASIMIAASRAVEWLLCKKCIRWQFSGRYGQKIPGRFLYLGTLGLTLLIIPITLVWSFAQRWSFPQLLPTQWSNKFWLYEWDNIINAIEQSIFVALTSSTVALLFAIIAHEYHTRSTWRAPNYIIAIPMLIPQLSILFGIQIMTLITGSDLHLLWVCWAHVLFAFPYVYLSLDGPWRNFNVKLIHVATSLGKSPAYAWWNIKLPYLLPGVVIAWSVGASVSLAQYLPTLMLGSGRVNTITTEAVAIASGADRRVTAIYALWQTFLPLIFFSIAMLMSYKFSKKYRITNKGSSANDAIT